MNGLMFGRLRVLSGAGRNRHGQPLWKCACTCGQVCTILQAQLRSGRTQSCGCLQRQRTSQANTKHGHRRGGKHKDSPEYRTWLNMLRRCSDPKDKNFPRYGARGISVCEEWRKSFVRFLADMGPKPSPIHSIDRIDNDGSYAPHNCRWATPREQTLNSRVARILEHRGLSLCLTEWAERLGITQQALSWRLRNGWERQLALTTVRTMKRLMDRRGAA